MTDTVKSSAIGPFVDRRNKSDAGWYGTLVLLLACVGLLATLFLAGCSGSSQAHAVSPSLARQSLKTALEQWKKGEGPRYLATSSTPMTIQDFDWLPGAKLVEDEFLGDRNPQDANLSIQVKLTLSDSVKDNGKNTENRI
jgi:hypothetical protein